MKHPEFALIATIIFIASTTASPETDLNNARGVLGVFLGGQTFRACHCRCGLSAEDQRRKFGQGLGLFPALSQGLSPKMVGGVIVEPHNLPWLSIVIVKGNITAMGALISDKHVLTAAAPFNGVAEADTKVTLGAHDRCVLDNSGNFSVSRIILHPNFDFSTRAHDLALLRLSNFITFNKYVIPICLPTKFIPYNGQQVTVASWGNVDPPPTNASLYSCTPKRLRLPVLSNNDCSKSVTTSSLLTSDKNCIGLFGSNSVICSIDVGAPVQYQVKTGHYELIGILTNANVCNVVNSTLFVRVHDHLQWIKENIRPDCSCNRF